MPQIAASEQYHEKEETEIVMSTHTLLLTPWMQPHRIVPWETAITLLFNEKIEVIEEYEEIVRSPSMQMQIPAVARLVRAVSHNKKGVKFSRINVLMRDKFTCQYCGRKLPQKVLNFDHVIPRLRGGKTVWENIVTSCYPCNSRKAGRTPSEANMKLRRQPFRPASLPISPPMLFTEQIPEPWTHYMSAS